MEQTKRDPHCIERHHTCPPIVMLHNLPRPRSPPPPPRLGNVGGTAEIRLHAVASTTRTLQSNKTRIAPGIAWRQVRLRDRRWMDGGLCRSRGLGTGSRPGRIEEKGIEKSLGRVILIGKRPILSLANCRGRASVMSFPCLQFRFKFY